MDEIDIKKMMWKKVGIVRRKKELIKALNYFENYKKQIDKINIINNLKVNETLEIIGDIKTLRKLFEIVNLTEVAITITKATLARSKSIGAHYLD